MTFNPTVRKLILEGQDEKLVDAIRLGKEEGMQDFTMSLQELVETEMIDRAAAFEVAPNPEALKMALRGIEVRASAMLVERTPPSYIHDPRSPPSLPLLPAALLFLGARPSAWAAGPAAATWRGPGATSAPRRSSSACCCWPSGCE